VSGHSHWATIKHRKEAADAKKGKVFSKLAKAIMVAARGGSDLSMNIRLRAVVDEAKAASMPRGNIERAIKKGAGELEGEQVSEVSYEGYAPGGIALLVECVTDKINRTISEVRKIFETRGGKLGKSGSVAFLFQARGLVAVKRDAVDEEALIELALEAGAEDVKEAGSNFEIITLPEAFAAVKAALAAKDIPTEVAELTRIATAEIEPDADTARKALVLMQVLEEHDDVQNVYANFSPSEEVVAGMG